MPTKSTIEHGAGTFYMTPLEGGDPLPFGPVKDCTETIEREFIEDGPFAGLCTAVNQTVTFTAEMDPGEAWERFQELFIKPVAEFYRQRIRDLAAVYGAWCTENHPDWVHILRRTKKKRTRKKYHDRLRRAFLEEVNHGKA